MVEFLSAFSEEAVQTIILAAGSFVIWKTKVSGRLDAIEEEIQSAENSRRELHQKHRKLERRLDRAGIPNGE